MSVYTPLNPKQLEIRVLDVQGDQVQAQLVCNLRTVSLLDGSNPKYDAISYCWGEKTGTGSIILNGATVEVPNSAAGVLRHFRPASGTHTLWIDAVCINQRDVRERSTQVSIMHHVYQDSTRTLIWLGEADEVAEQAFRMVDAICRGLRAREACTDESDSAVLPLGTARAEVESVIEFVRRPWFSRVWVLQEACLAPVPICFCGELSVPWEDICAAVEWIPRGLPHVFGYDGSTDLDNPPGLNMCLLGFLIRKYPAGGTAPSRFMYRQLLTYGRSLEASEPKDKCYGLRGLAWRVPKEGADSESLPGWAAVDYNKSLLRVCRDATRLAILQTGGLEVLDEIDTIRLDDRDLSQGEWLSWVPHWHQEKAEGRVQSLLLLDRDQKRFACGGGLVDTDLARDAGNTPFLPLRGFVLDRISFCGRDFQAEECAKDVLTTALELVTQGRAVSEAGSMEYSSSTGNALNAVTAGAFASLAPDWMMRKGYIASLAASVHGSVADYRARMSRDGRMSLCHAVEAQVSVFARGRTLFVTEGERFGLGPAGTQAGDLVVALFGGRPAYVLRPHEASPALHPTPQFTYRLVGTCYVHGIMYGEAVDDAVVRGDTPSVFNVW